MSRLRLLAAVCCPPVLFCALAPGVQPATWTHATEADFGAGRFEATVPTSQGEIRLGREIQVLVGGGSAPAVVSCLAVAGKTVYFGSGAEPVVYKLQGEKAAKFAELPGTMVGCLVWTGKDLLVGTCGEKAGVYRLDGGGKSRPLWTDEKVKYVWAIVRSGEDLFAATGPEGKVFAIEKDGKAQAVYEAGKLAKNILCLAADKAGKLYAGTDENGLVVEIDPKARTGRVLLDAAEKEIAALVLGADGEVFAATSDASKASPDRAKQPSDAKEGRADQGKPSTQPKPAAEGPATAPAPRLPTGQEPNQPPDATAGKGPEPKAATKDEPKPDATSADGPGGDAPKPDGKSAAGVPAAAAAPTPPTVPPAPPASSRGASPRQPGPPPGMIRTIRTSGPPPSGPTPAPAPSQPSAQGNAVYLIRPDGLVETVFRKPVTILDMLWRDGRLVLATGNGGGIYTVTPDGDEVAQAADTDAKQVTALAAGDAGEVLFGTANHGSVGRLGERFAKTGTYVTKALDAQQIAKWGTLQVLGSAPEGAKLTVATRSGNLAEPEDRTWSSWSKEMPLEEGFLPIGTPAGRFLQYRLTFSSDGRATPTVRGVEIVYQVANLAPSVAGVTVTASDKGRNPNEQTGGPKSYRHILIKAADENGDKLRFILEFREVGTEPWVQITDKLAEPKFVWDARSVGDGRYELRVTANDDPANPPDGARQASRVSEPFIIDNAAPVLKNFGAKPAEGGATVTGVAEDLASRVASLAFAVDSQDDWTALLPSDGICDSGLERFSFDVKDLKPGTHRIAVRAEDILGNVGFGAVIVRVGK